MKKLLLPTAYGTRDIIALEAYNKRIMETNIANIFIKWGYQEVVTPTYEFLDTFNIGTDKDMEAQSIKFFDSNNKTLVLRPDMTAPIARLVSTRLYNPQARVHKLFYIANVFRHEQTQSGRQCEFYQAGVECFGVSSPLADAEIVALAIESIKSTGLTQFTINLGHVDFINGLLLELDLEDTQRSEIQELINNKNAVGLNELVQQLTGSEELLLTLRNILFLKGDINFLQNLRNTIKNTISLKALDNLLEIYKLLTAYKLENYIVFDLGLTRDMHYYSGMVFEGYTADMGYSLCGGGRYDRLMDAFGLNCSATGFALGIERITLLLARQGLLQKPAARKVLIVWSENTLDKAIQQAAFFQNKGYITTLAPHQLSAKEITAFESEKIYDDIIRL